MLLLNSADDHRLNLDSGLFQLTQFYAHTQNRYILVFGNILQKVLDKIFSGKEKISTRKK